MQSAWFSQWVWILLVLLLPTCPYPGETKRVELTASVAFPSGLQVTALGHHDPLPSSRVAECVLRCAQEEACTYSGYDPGDNLCYFFEYGLPPDPSLNASALQYFISQESGNYQRSFYIYISYIYIMHIYIYIYIYIYIMHNV